MKKINRLSIIAMLLLLSLPCRAQISSIIAEATPQFSNDSGIVRYWRDSIFISCNKDHQRKYVFSLVEGSNTTILQAPIHVPDIEKVTDFQILDGYVYFCGTGSVLDQSGRNVSLSIIGRFSIDDIYAGTIVYEIMRLQYDYKLFRLAVYDINQPHIVALGYVMTNGKEKGILIECFYDYAQNDFVGYQYYYCSGSYPIFDDIVVTDNYVVIVADYGHLCLYRCPKANIAAGIMGNEYHYNTLYVRQPERDMLAGQSTCVKSYQENVSLLNTVPYSKVQSPYMSASYKPVTFKVPQPIDQYLINVTCQ